MKSEKEAMADNPSERFSTPFPVEGCVPFDVDDCPSRLSTCGLDNNLLGVDATVDALIALLVNSIVDSASSGIDNCLAATVVACRPLGCEAERAPAEKHTFGPVGTPSFAHLDERDG